MQIQRGDGNLLRTEENQNQIGDNLVGSRRLESEKGCQKTFSFARRAGRGDTHACPCLGGIG